MSGAKVVGIHGGSKVTDQYQSAAKPLPAPLTKLRESLKQKVHSLLRKLFENADDALFAMADKAGTNGDQALYFDAMRELRLQKKQIATNVLKGVIRSFNELGHYRGKREGEEFAETDFEELSLIQNDDLELNVAIEGMVSRLRNSCGSALDDLRARTEFLISPVELRADQTPVSPEILCECFAEACEELDVEIRARLVVLKLFEKYVLSEMTQVYADANQFLIQLGVAPELKRSRSRRPGAAPSRPAPQGKMDESSGRASGYYPQSQQEEDGLPVLGSQQYIRTSTSQAQFEELRNLMHQGESVSATEPPMLSEVYYSQDDLVGALSAFQTEHIEQLGSCNVNQVINFRELLDKRLASGECSAGYSEMDSDVINLVSMLFDFILDDRQLQSTMKALIARLQIPILKVAIMDRSFFNKGGHPARKLLNEIASAAIGWNENKEAKSDRLKDKIESVVEAILKDFDQDISLFSELLEDFVAFMDLERRRGQLVEQRTKDSEKGKAANELAKKAVQEYLNGAMKHRSVPECVVELLRDGWSNLMVLHYLKEGDSGEPWKQDCKLVEDLIWTVCPHRGAGDTRSQLLQKIPDVMKGLREGLSEVSFDEFRAKALIKGLENAHIQALQKLQLEETQDEAEHTSSAIVDSDALLEQDDAVADLVRSTLELEADFNSQGSYVSDDGDSKVPAMEVEEQSLVSEDEVDTTQENSSPVSLVETTAETQADKNNSSDDLEAAEEIAAEQEAEEIVLVSLDANPDDAVIDENDPFVQQVDKFAVGCWFEFESEDKAERCKLAAIIRATGKYIFVNRSGVKVAEKTRMGLAVELRRGSLQILNDGLLFDRALESIITNLRGKNKD